MRLTNREAPGVTIDNHRADASRAGSEAAEYKDVFVQARIAAKRLLAIQPANAVLNLRQGRKIGQCTAGLRLGKRNRDARFSHAHAGQIFRLLSLGTPFGDEHSGARDCHERGLPGFRTGPRKMFDGKYAGKRVPAFSSQFSGQANAENPELSQKLYVLARAPFLVASVECLGAKLLGSDSVDQIDKFLVFFRKREIHLGHPLCGTRPLHKRGSPDRPRILTQIRAS